MRRRHLLALASSSFAIISACSPSSSGVDAHASNAAEQAIINGELCESTVEPTAVAIMVDATITMPGFGTTDIVTVMCTGTVIAPDVVLTAAHCTDLTALTFGFGTVDREEFYISFEADLSAYASQQEGAPTEIPASAIPVREYVRHPEFSLDAFNEVAGPGDFKDVALLFLSAEVDVEPALLITEQEAAAIESGAAVRIAGWGQQTVTGGPFEAPPPGTVGLKVCGVSAINEVGAMEIQVGGDATTTRKCHGDSGGPTYLQVNGEDRVIGITSHAYDQEDCNKGGVDTRVDVWLDWLDSEMALRCDNGTRVWCDVPGIIPPEFDPDGGEGGEEGEGDEDGDDPDGDDDEDGGCAQVARDPSLVVALLALFALARRRRR